MITWKLPNYFKGDAEKCYQELSQLDEITPENVLEFAKDEKTELHKCIEWDLEKAAYQWQLRQARTIIQFIVVTDEEEEDSEPVRVFQVSSEQNKYQPLEFFIKNDDEYQSLLKRAKNELRAIKERYKTLSELEKVFEAIDELL